MNAEELFVINGNVTEGYLGDENQAKILFLLREPNTSSGNGDEADIFWFYKVLRNEINFDDIPGKKERINAKKAKTKYINVLGRLAQLILKTDEKKEELLKQCAYINLYPFSGGNEQSDDYILTLKALKLHKCSEHKAGKIKKDSPKENIVSNRLEILKLIKPQYIVTTHDIFSALNLSNCKTGKGFRYKEKRYFDAAEWYGIEIYEFYHPCYPMNINNIYLN